MLAADQYTPADDTLIPTGEIKSGQGDAARFHEANADRRAIRRAQGRPGGYDHNYVLRGDGKDAGTGGPRLRARQRAGARDVHDRAGRAALHGEFSGWNAQGQRGRRVQEAQGFCLEAQHYPDSVNHANFPSTILRPGETYTQTTIYKFSRTMKAGRARIAGRAASPRDAASCRGSLSPSLIRRPSR